jgi:hypothetical protein
MHIKTKSAGKSHDKPIIVKRGYMHNSAWGATD